MNNIAIVVVKVAKLKKFSNKLVVCYKVDSRFSFAFDNLCVEILKRPSRGEIFSFRIGLTVCPTNQK